MTFVVVGGFSVLGDKNFTFGCIIRRTQSAQVEQHLYEREALLL